MLFRSFDAIDLVLFDLPTISIAPEGYVVVSANFDNQSQIGTQQIKLRSGHHIPLPVFRANRLDQAQDLGYIEILKSGKTVDFVTLGDEKHTPTTLSAWSGPALPALPWGAQEYGRAWVRPYRPTGIVVDTNTAADWVQVDWVTPAGRNDVPAGTLDTDQDGIPDSAEVQGGTFAGLDLYAMGARTGVKDLFLEIDQMQKLPLQAGLVVQKAALQKVVQAFARQNIRVRFDVGDFFNPDFSVEDFNLGQTDSRVPFDQCVALDQVTCSQNLSDRRSIYDWKNQYMDLRRQIGRAHV